MFCFFRTLWPSLTFNLNFSLCVFFKNKTQSSSALMRTAESAHYWPRCTTQQSAPWQRQALSNDWLPSPVILSLPVSAKHCHLPPLLLSLSASPHLTLLFSHSALVKQITPYLCLCRAYMQCVELGAAGKWGRRADRFAGSGGLLLWQLCSFQGFSSVRNRNTTWHLLHVGLIQVNFSSWKQVLGKPHKLFRHFNIWLNKAHN